MPWERHPKSNRLRKQIVLPTTLRARRYRSNLLRISYTSRRDTFSYRSCSTINLIESVLLPPSCIASMSRCLSMNKGGVRGPSAISVKKGRIDRRTLISRRATLSSVVIEIPPHSAALLVLPHHCHPPFSSLTWAPLAQ